MDFKDLGDLHYLFNDLFYLHHLDRLPFFRDDFFYVLDNCHNFLLDDRHFNPFLNFFDDLVNHWHYSFHNLLNFLHPIHINNLFLDDLNFLDCWHFHSHLNNFLDYLWDLLDPFYDLNDRDYFLYDSFNDLRNLLDVVDDFTSSFVLDCVH